MIRALQMRASLLILLFACGFTAISSRLIYLQLVKHEKFRDQAIRTHYDVVPLAPRRGSILDAKGRILAQTVNVTDLRIDGMLALQKPEEIDAIESALGWNPGELRSQLDPGKRYLLLREDIPDELENQLRALKARCLIFDDRLQRAYPNGHEASHVIGFVNSQIRDLRGTDKTYKVEEGMDGVERVMNGYLEGTPGERRIVRDGRQKEIAGYRQMDMKPRDGLDVVLTVDQGVQHAIETEADKLVEQYHPESVHIIAVRPSTGEILGMVNRPTYDPNDRTSMQPINLRNGALVDIYEPGSTFKIVTLGAVLTEGVADLGTPIYCDNGQFVYANSVLKDTSPHGTLTLREAVAKSSNIAFAKLGLYLGDDKIYRYVRQFGFGELAQNPTQALYGEQRGIVRPPSAWSKVSPTRVPIGYEIGATNLQMVMAYAAVANEGKLMEPRLIRAVTDRQGRVVKEYLPRVVRQVVSKQVASEMIDALRAVVNEGGTGTNAAVPGLDVVGKTGTSLKAVNGTYDSNAHYSSFMGFFPADHPEIVISVVVDDAKGPKYYGGAVAGPAFHNIAVQVAQQFNIMPREPGAMMADRRVHEP